MLWEPYEPLKQRLLDSLNRWQTDSAASRSGIHVTDLTLCLRQSALKRLQPRPPTEKQLGWYLDGASRHAALQRLIDVESEVKVRLGEAYGSIDLLDGDWPVEFKTARGRIREVARPHWERQLAYYMLAQNVDVGYFIVQWLNPVKDEPVFSTSRVRMPLGERYRWQDDFQSRVWALRAALDSRDYAGLPVLRGEEAWACRDCLWRDLCA